MKCETVETALCDAMEEWLDNYIIQLEAKVEPTIDPIDTALEAVRGQLSALQDQQENICEYLEKGIYTKESSLETGSKESHDLPFAGRRNGHPDLSEPPEINIPVGRSYNIFGKP